MVVTVIGVMPCDAVMLEAIAPVLSVMVQVTLAETSRPDMPEIDAMHVNVVVPPGAVITALGGIIVMAVTLPGFTLTVAVPLAVPELAVMVAGVGVIPAPVTTPD